MEENELQEFSLEDIIKEFGGTPEPEEETGPELTEEQPEEDVKVFDFPSVSVVKKETTEETVRLDAEKIASLAAVRSMEGDTVRLDTDQITQALEAQEKEEAPGLTEDTIRLDASQVTAAAAKVKEEPFSQEWEPEYEQPMGEYVPAQPIIFHPRSRLRELKRKLVAGPEKRYYELSEVGVGKLQMALVLNFFVVLLFIGASALYAVGLIGQERIRFMIFGQLFLMLLSALLGSYQLIEGVGDILRGRFTLNTLLVITFAVCCVDAALGLAQRRVPCCAAFSVEMFMSLWSAYHKRSIEMGMMDTMRKAIRLDKLCAEADYHEGEKGYLRGEGQVEDFMDTYAQLPTPEKTLNWYALAAMVASIAIGAAAWVKYGFSTGITVLSASLLASVPVTAFIAVSRPYAILEKQLHALGTVLCGWKGVQGLCGKAYFPLSHEDLFPQGSAKMNGVKFMGTREPDEIVAYCTALVVADGGGLAPLFTQVLDSRNGHHYDVENLRAYEGGGIGGEVCGEPVLVGTLSFLKRMGVEIPEGIRVNQAVCVAIDGELCGLFAVTYEKSKPAAAGLAAMCSYRRLKPILTNGDFMLTEGFLRAKFSINPRRFILPDQETCAKLSEKSLPEDAQALLLTTKEGLAPLAFGVTGARSLHTAAKAGTVIAILGGILGLGISLVLTLTGGVEHLTPVNMVLYQLVWMVPGLLASAWTRHI